MFSYFLFSSYHVLNWSNTSSSVSPVCILLLQLSFLFINNSILSSFSNNSIQFVSVVLSDGITFDTSTFSTSSTIIDPLRSNCHSTISSTIFSSHLTKNSVIHFANG